MLKSLPYSLLLVLLLFTGCVFDDLSNCQRTTLSFTYFADGTENLIDEYITKGTLFIYDNYNQLVYEQALSSSVLHRNAPAINLVLKPGDYTVVCWGNLGSNSSIIDQEHYLTARLQAPVNSTKNLVQSNEPIYFSTQKIKVLGRNRPTHSILKFQSSYIKFDVFARNLSGLNDGEQPKLIISNLIPEYDFEMQPTKEPNALYSLDLAWDEDNKQYSGNTNVFRFSQYNSISFELIHPITNQSLLNGSISLNELLVNSTVDFDIQELTIPIYFDFKGEHPMISIDDWAFEVIVPKT